MYENLTVFRTAVQMAKHAGTRQTYTASNIANADTPGFRAIHMASFADVAKQSPSSQLRQTRPAHLGLSAQSLAMQSTKTQTESSPNGNAVSLEEEMMNAVEIAREHRRALTVYRHAMTVIRTSLGR